MSNAQFRAIYWNASVADSTQTSLGYATIKDQMNAFVNAFADTMNYSGSPTSDYSIVQQYGSSNPISALLPNAGFRVDTQPAKSKISDTGIPSYLATLFTRRAERPSAQPLARDVFTVRGGDAQRVDALRRVLSRRHEGPAAGRDVVQQLLRLSQ